MSVPIQTHRPFRFPSFFLRKRKKPIAPTFQKFSGPKFYENVHSSRNLFWSYCNFNNVW